jgi:hypothetical protein
MRYCIMEDDVEMAMRDWPDDWKIPVLDQEVPQGTEVDAGQAKTPAGDKVVPKNLKPTQKWHNKRRGVQERRMHRQQRRMHRQERRTLPRNKKSKEQGLWEHREPPQHLPPKNQGHLSGQFRSQEECARRRRCTKSHPEYTITEDDVDLVAEKVQDRVAEDVEEAKHQRGKIQDDLASIRQVLEKIRAA